MAIGHFLKWMIYMLLVVEAKIEGDKPPYERLDKVIRTERFIKITQ